MDAGRSVVVLALLAVVFSAWFFLLPWIQAAVLPTATGGPQGPWVLRPIIAVRFCASAFLSALSLPFLMKRFGRRWNAADAAVGTRYDPFRGRPGGLAMMLLAGSALALIYGVALLFYVCSWTVVGPAGIEERLPWGRRSHSFDQIASLEMIPGGMHSDEVARDGPWHRIVFVDDRNFTFGNGNEGCSEAEISAIATFIAKQSRQTWRVRPDAKPH